MEAVWGEASNKGLSVFLSDCVIAKIHCQSTSRVVCDPKPCTCRKLFIRFVKYAPVTGWLFLSLVFKQCVVYLIIAFESPVIVVFDWLANRGRTTSIHS